MQATPEEKASWPAPNFDDPESCGEVLVALTALTLTLVLIFTGVRFYGKGILRQVLGLDDWIMLVAAITSIPVSVIAVVSLNYGLGLHIWDQKAEWATTYGKMAFTANILFPLSCSLTKISLCLTYLRLFPSKVDRMFCHVLSVFVTLFTVTCLFLMLFQCKPIRGYWDVSAKQSCINMQETLVAIAGLNCISDILVYLWPAKSLWSLQLPLQRRLGLIFIFAVGLVVCVAGICRIYYLEVYFESYDTLWNATAVYTVMICEMNLGIICGSLSGVKPVLGVIFPRLFSTSHKAESRPAYNHTGRTTRTESFPFHPLSDVSNLSKARDRKMEKTVVEGIELHEEDVAVGRDKKGEQGNFVIAWASADGDADYVGPEGVIGVESTVEVREEEDLGPENERSRKGSEEWIMEDRPEPVVR